MSGSGLQDMEEREGERITAMENPTGFVEDVEKGAATSIDGPTNPLPTHTQNELLTLGAFRQWAGISGKEEFNKGVYQKVVRRGRSARLAYIISSRLIIICIVIQIMVGAALTALGASNASSIAVTVLGAVNTAIAGFLAYLKGSGLPNQAKSTQMKWNELQDYIEQCERELRIGFTPVDTAELKKIEAMYKKVQTEIEVKSVDWYGSATKQTNTSGTTGGPPSALPETNSK